MLINIQSKFHQKYSVTKDLEHAKEEEDKTYRQKIQNVENATFYPVIFTTKGTRSRKCARALFMKRLVSGIAIKRKQPSSAQAISTDISARLLRSEISCIRGNRRPSLAITMLFCKNVNVYCLKKCSCIPPLIRFANFRLPKMYRSCH